MFIALKGTYFCILFDFTAASVVPCGGRKMSPRTSTIVQFIFHFWSFANSERILRNQKLTIALTGTYFCILFDFTAAGVVPCGGRKMSPRTSTIVQFIFHFWSFANSERILRNQKLTII